MKLINTIIFIFIVNHQADFINVSYSLGTIIQFKVYGKKAQQSIDKAIEKIMDIDNKMSVFKNYSELSKINNGHSQGHGINRIS